MARPSAIWVVPPKHGTGFLRSVWGEEEAMTHTQALSEPAASAAWDAIAAGYDEFVTPTHMWLGDEGLRRAGLRPGMRFLDVAAGTGALSLPAARLGARVLSTDLPPVILEPLAARARRDGRDADALHLAAHGLELDLHRLDGSGSDI